MHPALRRVAELTAGTPWEGQLWMVGGAVRDELLGLGEPTDFDVVLEGDALAVAEHLFRARGLDGSPNTYPRFGTVAVGIGGTTVELVTARRESYHANSRKPNVEPASLREDAMRRDFTANTLMRNLHTGVLADPLGVGLDDLRDGVLRTPLDPAETFHDDPLRMLRAVRFRWKLGWRYADGLADAIRHEAHRLDIISRERIRDEWTKMLEHSAASSAMRDLLDLGLLERFAPEFPTMVGVSQGKWHHLDVWDHTLAVLDNVVADGGDLRLRLSALFHDIAKPPTRLIDDHGDIRFFGHEVVGAEMTRARLRELRFGEQLISEVALLVKNHMRLSSGPSFTPSAARRLMRDLRERVDDLIALVDADARGLKAGTRKLDLSVVRERLAEVQLQTPVETLQSPLSGEEVMALTRLSPGPEVGRIKTALQEMVLEGELAPDDKERARSFVTEWMSQPDRRAQTDQ